MGRNIGELQEIATMSDEDIKKSITEKSGDNIGGFINLVEYKESFFTKVISKETFLRD